jgi:hypothetical protein
MTSVLRALARLPRPRVCLSLVVGLLAGLAPAAQAGSLTLAWNPNTEPNLGGYIVSYRSEDNAHLGSINVGLVTQATVPNLQSGKKYFLTVLAYSTAGLSGPHSGEVSAIVTGSGPPPPPQLSTSYFAEGAAGIFDYRLALLNTAASHATVNVSFLMEGAAPVTRTYAVPAQSRKSVSASDVPEIGQSPFGAVVAAPGGVVSERTMSWKAGSVGDAHTAKSLQAPSTQWFLAEGNAGFFETFVLLANPNPSPVTANVSFLTDTGDVIARSYVLDAHQRKTIFTNELPELTFRSFATIVEAAAPILVERAMYFRNGAPIWQGGHASAAVTTGATSWFLAEGRTGHWFDTFVLIGNPNPSPVTATINYLTPAGLALTETRTLQPTSRLTIPVDALPKLDNTEVSVAITATAPIIVERSMYWPEQPGPWHSAHNSVGLTELATKWALAEGEVGGPSSAATFVLLANPGGATANVTLTVYRAPGFGVKQFSRTVGPGARVTVSSDEMGLSSGEQFGVVVDSTQPIAVERSIYWTLDGQLWTSGTNETGTKMP